MPCNGFAWGRFAVCVRNVAGRHATVVRMRAKRPKQLLASFARLVE
jgi:hypothetical protein